MKRFLLLFFLPLALNSQISLPIDFEITAESEDGEIMGIRHKEYFLEGIQFHPESIKTIAGKDLLKNFLNLRC